MNREQMFGEWEKSLRNDEIELGQVADAGVSGGLKCRHDVVPQAHLLCLSMNAKMQEEKEHKEEEIVGKIIRKVINLLCFYQFSLKHFNRIN